jgi:hypothetical protein
MRGEDRKRTGVERCREQKRRNEPQDIQQGIKKIETALLHLSCCLMAVLLKRMKKDHSSDIYDFLFPCSSVL